VTGEFLDSLAAALSFDRALARRVRKEFEDHLQQAGPEIEARIARQPSGAPSQGSAIHGPSLRN